MKCLNCGKETTNPKFCGHSCAAKYNNTRREKEKYYCTRCGVLLGEGYTFKNKVCRKCNKNYKDWSQFTYGDLLDRRTNQAHAHIRDIARRVYAASDKPKCCANCGYDKHYEICHIKPIESYSRDEKISVINDIHNLIALCPNCHWELDYGDLECKEE